MKQSIGGRLRQALYMFLQRKVYAEALIWGALYRNCVEGTEIERWQLEKFNAVWEDAFRNLPFYRQWKERHGLPDRIASLDELQAWPVVSKQELQQTAPELLHRPGVKPDGYLLTGGSTGQPLRLGVWSDRAVTAGIWLGQAANGIYPHMRTFHLWGHGHLFGKGLKRQVLIFQRLIKDRLSNRMRFPAYDLSEQAMERAFGQCRKWQPEVFSGFSASVLIFCRINRNRNRFLPVPPKAVMCTAGPLSKAEREEIEAYFQAPVCMEYGSADCALMAYTVPQTGRYRVFWGTHLLQGVEGEGDVHRNIVTRLSCCYFPQIRYDVGDFVELPPGENPASIRNIVTVSGRSNERICLENGAAFWCVAVQDCIKQVPGTIAVQLELLPNRLNVNVVALSPLGGKEKQVILNRLHNIVSGLDGYPVEIQQVSELIRTPAGKVPLVINKSKKSQS